MIGDVIGKPGRVTLEQTLPTLRDARGIDFVTANGENLAGGMGLTISTARSLYDSGVDVITSGNHIWDKREIIPELDRDERILRPINYGTTGVPGRGWGIFHALDGTEVAVVNAQGRSTMQPIDNPFHDLDRLLEERRDELPAIRLVDFHCELTSEKTAFGLHLDGRVSVVVGTHTHVPTADERILPRGTAYVSDLGMTGPARQRHRLRARDGAAPLPDRPAHPLRGRQRPGGVQRPAHRHRAVHGSGDRRRADPAHRRGMTTLRRNRVDLHCHTRRSDGVLEPAELYAAMRAWGLRLAAITDHDTLAGYRELRAAGHRRGRHARWTAAHPGARDQHRRQRGHGGTRPRPGPRRAAHPGLRGGLRTIRPWTRRWSASGGHARRVST